MVDLGSYHVMFGRPKIGNGSANNPHEVRKIIDKTELNLGFDGSPPLMADRLMWQQRANDIKILFNHGTSWQMELDETEMFNWLDGRMIPQATITSQRGRPQGQRSLQRRPRGSQGPDAHELLRADRRRRPGLLLLLIP